MKSKLSILGFLLILSTLIISGCKSANKVSTIAPVEVATEQPTEITPTKITEEAPDEVRAARDVALAYVSGRYGKQAPALGLAWAEAFVTPEGMVGSGTYQYSAGDWMITISYPVVAPEAVIYQVAVANPTTGFQWEGEVNAVLQVTETLATAGGQPVVGWLGRVVSLPSGGQFDDYLVLEPEGAGEAGLTGADNTVAAQIQMLRDSDTYAHFWGTLTCPVLDYGSCQLVVTRLREARPGPSFDPDPVEGWEGIIVSYPPGSQFDDYFCLAGDFPTRYGIESHDPALAAQLAGLRDTGITVRVWGELVCPAMDAFGTEIVVSRIEIVGEALPVSVPPPTAVPTPTPPEVGESVEGWIGTIVQLTPGSQYGEYFERSDGQTTQ